MADKQATSRTQRIVLAATILGSSMAFLDGTVINLALPILESTFNTNVSIMQWVVEAYALTLASLLLVGGSLGDRYGRRGVYVCGVLVFAISSVACGFAVTTRWLIAARAVQGIGAALLIPGSLALISSTFPESERGRAIGTWSGLSAVTTAIGPMVGGWLIEHWSWRWVFFLNLPLALLVVVLCTQIPEVRDETATGPLDFFGAVLTMIGLSGITFALIEWQSMGHHGLIVTAFVGLLAFIVLGFVEKRAKAPMVPFNLFKSRDFTGTNLLTFFVYAPLGALLFLIPLDLIQIQHYSATKAGAAFSPFVVIMLILSRWAGRLVERYGPRIPLTLGPLLATVGYALFAVAPQDGRYWTSFFPGVLMLALGMTVIVAPLSTTVMNSVPRSYAGIASGINNAVSRTASLMAVAILGVLLVLLFNHSLETHLSRLSLPPSEVAQISADRLKLASIKISDVRAVQVITDSFVWAYRVVLWIAACSVLAGGFTGWFLIKPSPNSSSIAKAAL